MAVGNKGSGACCCFGCGRRSQSCHAQCEEYREYLKSNAEKRNAHLKERLALQGYSEHVARCFTSARILRLATQKRKELRQAGNDTR